MVVVVVGESLLLESNGSPVAIDEGNDVVGGDFRTQSSWSKGKLQVWLGLELRLAPEGWAMVTTCETACSGADHSNLCKKTPSQYDIACSLTSVIEHYGEGRKFCNNSIGGVLSHKWAFRILAKFIGSNEYRTKT